MMKVAVTKTNKNPRTIMVSVPYSHFKIMRATFLCHAAHVSNEKFDSSLNRYAVPSFDNIYPTRKRIIRRLRTLPTPPDVSSRAGSFTTTTCNRTPN
jgi:hypothetical protein